MPELGELSKILKRKVGNKNYFIGKLSSDIAKKVTFVPVVEDSDTYLNQILKDGYQRPGKKSRMNQFKKYLKEFSDRLIPPVILSARGKWNFKESEDSEIGDLLINGPAAIVDGQHRLGGIVGHFEDTETPLDFDFICFENLTLEEEKEEFKTINGKQVGVPNALQAFLGDDENVSIAWGLNINDDSPFYGRITRTTMTMNHEIGLPHLFALHSIGRNVSRSFQHGSLEDLDNDVKLDALIKYWRLIKDANSVAWSDAGKEKKKDHQYKLLELTGNIAWSLIAPEIFLKGFDPTGKSFDWAEIEKVIEFVSQDMDWEKQGEFFGMTGEVGGKRIF